MDEIEFLQIINMDWYEILVTKMMGFQRNFTSLAEFPY